MASDGDGEATLVATLAVRVMTLFIQRSNRRNTLASHANLDELFRVDTDARSKLTRLDEQEPEAIQKHLRYRSARHSGKTVDHGASKSRYFTSTVTLLYRISTFASG
jgi:low affinity Fe/Cu permease